MYKLCIPLFFLLLLFPPLAVAVVIIGATVFGITRLADRQSANSRRARQWYASV